MKKPTIIISICCLLVLSFACIVPAGATGLASSRLTIHITGFENSDGVAMVAVVNSRESFEAGPDEVPFQGHEFKIENGEVHQMVLLPYGEYAIKVFHDENANRELDTRIFGIPKEAYGFSNNARGTMGPPDYDDARFDVNAPLQELSIEIQ